MKVKIKRLLNKLRLSFWFIPGVMAILAALSGYGMQRLDLALYGKFDWTLTDSAGARAILTTIAASAITVAGVVFSITMVVLSSASNQYGPRLMQNFIRQPQSKWVLGGFIGIFIYCLMVTATVREGIEGWVPQISVTAGGVFGVLSFGLLIGFIHHVATFLQASQVIDDVSRRLHKNLHVFFPLSALSDASQESLKAGEMPKQLSQGRAITSQEAGYLQATNLDLLLEQATQHKALVRIHHKPGDYIFKGEEVATVWESQSEWENANQSVANALILGNQRTDDQDVEFGIDQLVEVAVRALSPGINDPFTALTCVKQLGSAMVSISEKGLPGGLIHDQDGVLRIATETYSYAGLLDAAFHQIRQNSRQVESVSLTMMETLVTLHSLTNSSEHRAELNRHADLLMEDVKEAFSNASDLQEISDRYNELTK